MTLYLASRAPMSRTFASRATPSEATRPNKEEEGRGFRLRLSKRWISESAIGQAPYICSTDIAFMD